MSESIAWDDADGIRAPTRSPLAWIRRTRPRRTGAPMPEPTALTWGESVAATGHTRTVTIPVNDAAGAEIGEIRLTPDDADLLAEMLWDAADHAHGGLSHSDDKQMRVKAALRLAKEADR